MGKPQRSTPRKAPLRSVFGFVKLEIDDEGSLGNFAVLECDHFQVVSGDGFRAVPHKLPCPACAVGDEATKIVPPPLPPAPAGMYWDCGVFGKSWEAVLFPSPPADAGEDYDPWDQLDGEPFNFLIPLQASFVEPGESLSMVAEAFYAKYVESIEQSLRALSDAAIAQGFALITGADIPADPVTTRPEMASLEAWLDSLREPWQLGAEPADDAPAGEATNEEPEA